MQTNSNIKTFEEIGKALGLSMDTLRIRYNTLKSDPKNKDFAFQSFNKSAFLSEKELKAILNAYNSGHHAIAKITAETAKRMLDELENIPNEAAKNAEELANEQARIDREASELKAKRQREESEQKAKQERLLHEESEAKANRERIQREQSEATAKREAKQREEKIEAARIEKELSELKANQERLQREASELKAKQEAELKAKQEAINEANRLKAQIEREAKERREAEEAKRKAEAKTKYEAELIERTKSEITPQYESLIQELSEAKALTESQLDEVQQKLAAIHAENEAARLNRINRISEWAMELTEFTSVNIISNIFAVFSIVNTLHEWGYMVAGILVVCFIGIIKVLNKKYSSYGAFFGILGMIIIESIYCGFHITFFKDLLNGKEHLPFNLGYENYAVGLAVLVSGMSVFSGIMSKADSADEAEKERCEAIDNRNN